MGASPPAGTAEASAGVPSREKIFCKRLEWKTTAVDAARRQMRDSGAFGASAKRSAYEPSGTKRGRPGSAGQGGPPLGQTALPAAHGTKSQQTPRPRGVRFPELTASRGLSQRCSFQLGPRGARGRPTGRLAEKLENRHRPRGRNLIRKPPPALGKKKIGAGGRSPLSRRISARSM